MPRIPKPPAETPGASLVPATQSTIVDLPDPKTASIKELVGFIRDEQAAMMRSSIRIGVALAAIKRRKLYQPYHPDIETFCWEEFGIRRSYMFYLLRPSRSSTSLTGSFRWLGYCPKVARLPGPSSATNGKRDSYRDTRTPSSPD